jgi:putative ABC transport system permease protein
MSIIGFIDSVARDLRYALRSLARRPAFTLAAVVTLAIGIGATTAVFSVVYSVLIKPLPYRDADELVQVRYSAAGYPSLPSPPSLYFTYRDESRTFASSGLWQPGGITLTGLGAPERVNALRVTDGIFRALGVQPMRGRSFTDGEYEPAAEGPAPLILSYAFWQRRFGGDETIIGRQLSSGEMLLEGMDNRLDSRPSQVVGIMPPDFRFLELTPQPDVILALQLSPPAQPVTGENYNFGSLIRLKPGVTLAEARADVERMLSLWIEAVPVAAREENRLTATVRPLKEDLVGSIASTLWVLMGSIGAVLLVACANIANLMLVRADARRQELAVRAALGAGRARIARESLVESLVLGAAGGALGLLLAYLGLKVLVALGPSTLPRLREIGVYSPVLAFAVAVSLASTLLFGSITALKDALRVDTFNSLVPRGATTTRERSATRSALVIAQVALALVLTVSAALMIRTFQALRDVDPGFTDPATIQTVRAPIPQAVFDGPEQRVLVQHEMLDRIAAIPGVTSAGYTENLPLERFASNTLSIEVEGQSPPVGDTLPSRRNKYVSPGYFETMGTRIIAGRDITWSDIEAGGRVTLISEDFARELAAEPAQALGKRLRVSGNSDVWREVIGVVQRVHETGLYEEAPSIVYWPAFVEEAFGDRAYAPPNVAFVIRSERAGTASLAAEIRQAIRSVNASVPVAAERTMQDLYSGSLTRTSFALVMLAIAGGMALFLGGIGIYGVIAYVVSQRAREIGIRSALGAEPGQLEKMFLLHGLALSGVGIVFGLVVAAGLGRLMSSVLFGVQPMDPLSYVAAVGVIIAAAALASYVPARRAAAIDPAETLRAE